MGALSRLFSRMLDDESTTTTTTAAAQPKKKKKKIITVVKKKKIKRIVPAAPENGIDDENDVVPTNGHPPKTPDSPEPPPMPSPSRQRVSLCCVGAHTRVAARASS